MEYKAIHRQRSMQIKVLLALAVTVMMIIEIIKSRYLYVPIGIFLLLACFLDKEYAINDHGVEIRYTLFGTIRRNRWSWDEITALHVDYNKANPDVILHIGKDIVTRTYKMRSADCEEVLKIAKKQNPRIHIGRID